MDKHIEEWQQQLVKCVRCGTCRAVCPVFKITDNENTTARGKVKLIEAVTDGKLELTREMQKRLDKCLLCEACSVGCPAGVKTDELFMSARRALADNNGISYIKKIIYTGMTYRSLFNLALRLGSVFQSLLFRDAPDKKGRFSRIPLPAAGLNKRRLFPALAKVPLAGLVPKVNKVSNPKARVAFFPGCMMNYVYTDSGRAVIDVLLANDVEVVMPDNLYCCGIMVAASGDYGTARHLAERNVAALSSDNYDAIITGCASCGATLKHKYGLVIDDPAVRQKWEKISEKVFDFTQYLTAKGYSREFADTGVKITYHDPCHLVRGMKVSKEPRAVLKSIPGVELAEMKDANKCCGCGGTFSATHYDISRAINEEKIDNVEKTGAEVLLTGCSGCRMHLEDGLSHRGSKMTVMHTAEFIANAYAAKKERGGLKQ